MQFAHDTFFMQLQSLFCGVQHILPFFITCIHGFKWNTILMFTIYVFKHTLILDYQGYY